MTNLHELGLYRSDENLHFSNLRPTNQRSLSVQRLSSSSKRKFNLETVLEEEKRSLAMRPMTQAEWEARQSVVRRVYDEETGRSRLVKGDGEILEEIVSRERHLEINKLATKGDGTAFQKRLGLSNRR